MGRDRENGRPRPVRSQGSRPQSQRAGRHLKAVAGRLDCRRHSGLAAQQADPESRDSGFDAAASPRNDRVSAQPLASLPKILLHLGAQAIAQFLARHAEGNIGTQETGLRAAIMALAAELKPIEFLSFGKPDHRIRKLDLAAGAVLLGLQDLENLRLEDVATGDREIGRRGTLWRLFDHSIDLEEFAVLLA